MGCLRQFYGGLAVMEEEGQTGTAVGLLCLLLLPAVG